MEASDTADKEPAIIVREPDATMQPTPQDIQLMSKHRVLSFKPQLRLERRGQDGQNETEQPDHSASLGDSITSSTQIRFSVHTTGAEPEAADLFKAGPHRCPDIGGVIGHDPAGCGGVPGRKGLKHGLMIEDRLFPGGVLKIAEVSDPPQPAGTPSVRFD